MWEKEKLLVTSNFSFSYSVFKTLVLQTRKNQGLFGKGLILCYLILFSTLFSCNAKTTSLIYAFLEFFLPVFCTIFFLSHWLLSQITIIKTMDRRERNESCCNGCHQSSDKMLDKPWIESLTYFYQVLFDTD